MTPLVRVATDPNESDQSELSLTLLRTPIVRGGGKEETQLRKRARKGTSTVGVVTVEEGMEYGEEVVKDPLKWFGVLLPKCLPQAQLNFMEGDVL